MKHDDIVEEGTTSSQEDTTLEIKIPTRDDVCRCWERVKMHEKQYQQHRVVVSFKQELQKMFLQNKSSFSIGVEASDLEFFLGVFQRKGYQPVVSRCHENVDIDQKELIFYRKDIEPDYEVPPSSCCVVL
jgi:hypothetical protein